MLWYSYLHYWKNNVCVLFLECMTVDFKDEPLSDDTEQVLSFFDVQQSDKQEKISEPFSFIAVKNEIQVNIFCF